MRSQGQKLDSIATTLGVSAMTAHRWTERKFKAKVEDIQAKAMEKMTVSFADRMSEDAQLVWGHLKEIATNASGNVPKHVMLNAIDSLLDRAGAPRSSKSEAKNEIIGLSDEKRKENFERVLAMVAPLEKKA